MKLSYHVLGELQLVTVVADTGFSFSSRHVRLTVEFLKVSVYSVELLHEERVQTAFFGDFTRSIEFSLREIGVDIDVLIGLLGGTIS